MNQAIVRKIKIKEIWKKTKRTRFNTRYIIIGQRELFQVRQALEILVRY